MKKWVVLKKKNISIWDEEWRSKSEKEIEKDLEKEMDILCYKFFLNEETRNKCWLSILEEKETF